MRASDFLILGGGIAGTTAAEALRELDPYAEIAIISDEPHTLYSRVRIPKYLEHKAKRDELFLRNLSDYVSKKIGLYLSKKAEKIDYQRREVYAEGGEVFPYKKLLIASGGRPKEWLLPGAPAEFAGKILRMHTLEDADNILAKMKGAAGKDVLVVGEGFIALEFIEVFRKNDLSVYTVFKGKYFNEKLLGESGGKILEDSFIKNGINLYKNTEPATVAGAEITFRNGKALAPELIGVGIGLRRNTDIFGGIRKNIGVVTNEFLETSEENVYAAGDIAEFPDVYSGAGRVLSTWTNSFLQGRAAAFNMFSSLAGDGEKRMPYQVVSSYSITNFNLKMTFLGYLEDADEVWEKQYEDAVTRVFLRDKKVRGAVLVNRFDDKVKIAELIKIGGNLNDVEKTL